MKRVDPKTILPISKNLRVLYVEDNKQAREQTVKLLENFFDHITVAVDGQEGWEKYQNDQFDIVFTDINMPHLSGLDMLKKIRERDIDITCIIISAHDEATHFTRSIELGIDGYLLKPISIDPFLQLLQKSVKRIQLHQERQNYRSSLEQEIIERTDALKAKLYIDDLTGISSRYAFLQELNQIDENEIPLIYLINIDGFTIYNELYGIEVGNEILIAFAKVVDNFAKEQGLRAYRVSGDEFVLYKTDNPLQAAPDELFIKALFNTIDNTPLHIESIDEYITVSITLGIACSRENPLGKADIALKAAKKSTKKYLVYHQELDNKVDLQKTLYWRKELVSALAENRIVPYFQPIVDRDEKIVKYEALMRIIQTTPEGEQKVISPFEFLDIAIKTKLYDAISMDMLPKAIDMMMNKDVSISVNINLRDVYNQEMITLLKQKIIDFNAYNQKRGRYNNHVILEILENDNIEHYHLFTKELTKFKRVAAKIAIDDFGSGYSNFSHIIGISPQYLKIDASLIKHIDKSRKSYEMVKAIVQFAQSLNIKTIAEFVSSKEIFDITRKLGVDEFQGYYFGKPMSIEEIEAKEVADIAL
jgi:diguanylate cyclase (GGDEF)-like protein